MKPYLLLPLLLLLPGCSRPTPQGLATPGWSAPVAMEFRSFENVQSPRNSSAPLQAVITHAGDGHSITSFIVTAPWYSLKPGQTIRDGAEIAADVAAHKGKAAKLSAERRAWNLLLKASPIILTQADLEPRCEANPDGTSLTLTLSPTGTAKFAQFTKDHVGNLVGVIVDDRLLSAPIIREPVLDGKVAISGGFVNQKETQDLAKRLNDSAGRARKP